MDITRNEHGLAILRNVRLWRRAAEGSATTINAYKCTVVPMDPREQPASVDLFLHKKDHPVAILWCLGTIFSYIIYEAHTGAILRYRIASITEDDDDENGGTGIRRTRALCVGPAHDVSFTLPVRQQCVPLLRGNDGPSVIQYQHELAGLRAHVDAMCADAADVLASSIDYYPSTRTADATAFGKELAARSVSLFSTQNLCNDDQRFTVAVLHGRHALHTPNRPPSVGSLDTLLTSAKYVLDALWMPCYWVSCADIYTPRTANVLREDVDMLAEMISLVPELVLVLYRIPASALLDGFWGDSKAVARLPRDLACSGGTDKRRAAVCSQSFMEILRGVLAHFAQLLDTQAASPDDPRSFANTTPLVLRERPRFYLTALTAVALCGSRVPTTVPTSDPICHLMHHAARTLPDSQFVDEFFCMHPSPSSSSSSSSSSSVKGAIPPAQCIVARLPGYEPVAPACLPGVDDHARLKSRCILPGVFTETYTLISTQIVCAFVRILRMLLVNGGTWTRTKYPVLYSKAARRPTTAPHHAIAELMVEFPGLILYMPRAAVASDDTTAVRMTLLHRWREYKIERLRERIWFGSASALSAGGNRLGEWPASSSSSSHHHRRLFVHRAELLSLDELEQIARMSTDDATIYFNMDPSVGIFPVHGGGLSMRCCHADASVATFLRLQLSDPDGTGSQEDDFGDDNSNNNDSDTEHGSGYLNNHEDGANAGSPLALLSSDTVLVPTHSLKAAIRTKLTTLWLADGLVQLTPSPPAHDSLSDTLHWHRLAPFVRLHRRPHATATAASPPPTILDLSQLWVNPGPITRVKVAHTYWNSSRAVPRAEEISILQFLATLEAAEAARSDAAMSDNRKLIFVPEVGLRNDISTFLDGKSGAWYPDSWLSANWTAIVNTATKLADMDTAAVADSTVRSTFLTEHWPTVSEV